MKQMNYPIIQSLSMMKRRKNLKPNSSNNKQPFCQKLIDSRKSRRI